MAQPNRKVSSPIQLKGPLEQTMAQNAEGKPSSPSPIDSGNGSSPEVLPEHHHRDILIAAEKQVLDIVSSEVIWDVVSTVIHKKQKRPTSLISKKSIEDEQAAQQGSKSKLKSVDKLPADKESGASLNEPADEGTSDDAAAEVTSKSLAVLAERKSNRPSSAPNKQKSLSNHNIAFQTPVSAVESSPKQPFIRTKSSAIELKERKFSSRRLSEDSLVGKQSTSAAHFSNIHSAPSPSTSTLSQARYSVDQEGKKGRKTLRRQQQQDDDSVAVGTKISEGHVNYALMYDMLTGIRIAVSRCVSKPHQELQASHFRARHKLTFDVMGNELTPSSKYDFKFKDYAPWVFRSIREHFKIEAADYLVSLTGKYVLSELGSPGKSGSFFYFSQDYRFIIKTIHRTEHKFLCKILTQYYEHVKTNPNTLLCRFYGLHRVKLPHGRKIHFVVMGNVFPPNKDIHERFDLKGSLIGREVSQEDIKNKPGVVMKDVNWLNMNKRLGLGPHKTKLLLDQLESDVSFLMDNNIMDYSLLTGIHFLQRGNSENIRETSLSVFEPDQNTLSKQPVSNKVGTRASNLRKVLAQSDPVQLGPSSNKLPEQTPAERKGCVFYADDGGFLSTDENNLPLNELYFIGVIDILTPYNIVKKTEHFWKSLSVDKDLISAVKPYKYGKRFLSFMQNKVVPDRAPNKTSTLDYAPKLHTPIQAPADTKDAEIVQLESIE